MPSTCVRLSPSGGESTAWDWAARTTAELHRPPCFRPGAKVRATLYVRNDGTFAGREIGEILVQKGDVGYVRDIGMYLQRYYIYAVEFIDRGRSSACAAELVTVESPPQEATP